MKFLIAAGGTGGHITPGISIATCLKNEGHEVIFIGTESGMEKELVPKAGFKIIYIHASGLSKGLAYKIKAIHNLNHGISECINIINEEKPDMCIGTGGYVTAPLMFAANKLKIPAVIHESNALPGKTTKMFAGSINEVCVGFPETKNILKKGNIVVTGNPNKMCLSTISKEDAKLKNNINGKLLLIFGGSQGAKKINDTICEIINNRMFGDYNVIYATGPKHFSEVSNKIIENFNGSGELKEVSEDEIVLCLTKSSVGSLTFSSGIDSIRTISDIGSKKVIIKKFIYNMDEIMKASDLVICRSGALTCTEISEVGVASILIPFPYAAENHQYYNAKVISDIGAGLIIEEKDLNTNGLLSKIDEIMNDDNKLVEMAENSKKLKTGNPVENIKNEIYKILKVQ